jgi:hypothetical protein
MHEASVTPLPEDKQRAWALDVWTEFLHRSGHPPTRFMSPLEFGVLSGWLRDGIPLRIVLAGLKDCKGKGGSLAYFDKPVRERYAHWRAALGGAA